MIAGMKYKTEWNLNLLYKNEKDPALEKDIADLEKACTAFEKKYRKAAYTETLKQLLSALNSYQSLSDSRYYKPFLYFYLRKESNANDAVAQANITLVEKRIADASSKVTFFTLDLAKLSSKQQKQLLRDPLLKEFHYFLKKVFESAKYNLSEPEEQLLMQLTTTSETMWASTHQKLLGNQKVELDGVEMPLAEARVRLPDLPIDKRYDLSDKINRASKEISFMSEAELNAIYTFHNTINQRKKFKTPYSASVLSKENTEKEIKDFIDLVTSYYPLSHRFYKLHAKILGLKKLRMADRRVVVGKVKTVFDFDTTYNIVRASLSRAGEQYGMLLDSFLLNGQIDVFPRVGKQAGGFNISIGVLPSFILLNHVENIDSVETLAHEMGHAIHAKLSEKQPRVYQETPTSTAEVASTFFEQFVALELDQYLSEEERFFMLHKKVVEDIYLIFCQVACFNYELELHELVRIRGQVSAREMALLMQKHIQAYCGPAIEITEDDGYLFVTWHHLRYNFYTYTYAYGGLISRTLFEFWNKNPGYIKKVEQFLSAGSSMSPKDIFKSIGITTDKKFFEAGLKGIEADVDRLEKLSRKWLKTQYSDKTK